MAGLAKHGGKRRARPAAIVQPAPPRRQPLQQRIGEPGEEAAVIRIFRIIAMKAVMRAFLVDRRVLARV
ncbi:MAG TPA: hypothetical protein VHG92_02385 [Afifellaceae bacterium]|nr:hypothetical protein [Afifellaceae bacterium]